MDGSRHNTSCPGRGAASFTLHRKAGTHAFVFYKHGLRMQRTTPQLRRAALHPEHEKCARSDFRDSIRQSDRANPD
jgi:hypothetical protein